MTSAHWGSVPAVDRVQNVVDGQLHHGDRAADHDGDLATRHSDGEGGLIPLEDFVGADACASRTVSAKIPSTYQHLFVRLR